MRPHKQSINEHVHYFVWANICESVRGTNRGFVQRSISARVELSAGTPVRSHIWRSIGNYLNESD